MYYNFTSMEILSGGQHEKPQAECTIVMQNGDVRVITLDLEEKRIRAIEAVLRHDIDALLNTEASI